MGLRPSGHKVWEKRARSVGFKVATYVAFHADRAAEDNAYQGCSGRQARPLLIRRGCLAPKQARTSELPAACRVVAAVSWDSGANSLATLRRIASLSLAPMRPSRVGIPSSCRGIALLGAGLLAKTTEYIWV